MKIASIDVKDGRGLIDVAIDDNYDADRRLTRFAFEAILNIEQLEYSRAECTRLLAENRELRKQLGHYAVGVPT